MKNKGLVFLLVGCFFTTITPMVYRDYSRLCCMISNNPEKILLNNLERWKELQRECSKLSISQFIQKSHDIMSTSLISWLTECFDDSCQLNRLSKSHRNAYGEVALRLLQEHYSKNKKNLSLISVGSGGMFQDMITVVQFLLWRKNLSARQVRFVEDIHTLPGKLRFDIHLIDPCYAQYHEFIENAKKARQREKEPAIENMKMVNSRDFILFVQKSTASYRSNNDFLPIQRKCYIETAQPFYAYHQFKSLIKEYFSEVDIEVIMHTSITDFSRVYGNDIPDVIIAADLQEENCVGDCNGERGQKAICLDNLIQPHQEYIAFVKAMCDRAKKAQRPPLANICLSKLNASLVQDGRAHLLTVGSDKQTQEYQEYCYQDLNSNCQQDENKIEHTFYLKDVPL